MAARSQLQTRTVEATSATDAAHTIDMINNQAIASVFAQLKKLDAREGKTKGELVALWIKRGVLLRKLKQQAKHGRWRTLVQEAGYNLNVCQRLMSISRSWLTAEIQSLNPLLFENMPRSIDGVSILARAGKDRALKVLAETKLGERKVAQIRELFPSARPPRTTRWPTAATREETVVESSSDATQAAGDDAAVDIEAGLIALPDVPLLGQLHSTELTAPAQPEATSDPLELFLRACDDTSALAPKIAAIDRVRLDQRNAEIQETIRRADRVLLAFSKQLGQRR